MMKKFIHSIIDIRFLLILLSCICGLNACQDDDMGEPFATKLRIESASYNVSITKSAIADTTVATIRWIDIQSPSYTLTLSNSVNEIKVELSDPGTASANVRSINFSDKQLLEHLTTMHLTEATTASLLLTITGTKTDGKPDTTTTTIKVTYLDANI